MKKLVLLILLILLIFSNSCDKNNCEDCNPYTSSSYFINNNYGQTVILDFYFQNNFEQLTIERNTKTLVYKTSRVIQEGKLKLEPYIYDSLKVYNDSKNEIYSFKQNINCGIISNGLCQKNYIIKNEYVDKIDNVYIDYELIIE